MDLQLGDKVAVVTGGSRGLGFASARALVSEGCRVAICARGSERLEQAAAELRASAAGNAEVLPIVADVSTADDVNRLIETASEHFGGLDILINNVGLGRGGSLEETSDESWHEAFDQTLFPAIRASRAAVPHLRRRGGGVIVIISSIFGREAGGRMTYNVVKAAEISLGKSLAQQLARDNIRVVTIAPGSILFPGGSWHARQQADPQGIAEFVKRELPFGRFGRTEEVGDVVAFVASPRASWIAGTTVVVDGSQSRMF
jgi:3-oxoacyl-[acyl-carrier protein] reductase